MINATVTGLGDVRKQLKKFGAKAELEAADIIEATANDMRNDVIKQIQGPPKTGLSYQRGTKVHVASKEGEAPATDTGFLVSSIYPVAVRQLTATLGSRLKYAYYLEFGTINIGPRPSWVPAAERARAVLKNRLSKMLKKHAARFNR